MGKQGGYIFSHLTHRSVYKEISQELLRNDKYSNSSKRRATACVFNI